jgi:capsular polysaccharide biosynthesis protein
MELSEYLSILSRRRLTIIVVTLLVTAAAIIVSVMSADEVTSRAVVVVPSVRAESIVIGMAADVALEREVEIARSAQVMALAADASDESVASLRAAVSVAPAVATSRGTIAITATGIDGERAARMANSVAESYVDYANSALLADLERYQAAVRSAGDEATDETIELFKRLDATELDVAGFSISRDTASLDTRLADIWALMGMDTSHAQLLTSAEATSANTGTTRNAVLGLTLGLFLGIAAAFVQEQVDDRVRRAETVRQAFPGVPVFDSAGADLPALADSLGLLAAMLSQGSGGAAVAYAITAPTSSVRSAEVAAGLAQAFANRGERVAAVAWGVPGDRMMAHPTAGSPPVEVVNDCTGPAARDALRALRGQNTVVVIDAAPLLARAETGQLAGQVDGAVLAVQTGSTRTDELRESARLLEVLRVPLAAIVLLGVGASRR